MQAKDFLTEDEMKLRSGYENKRSKGLERTRAETDAAALHTSITKYVGIRRVLDILGYDCASCGTSGPICMLDIDHVGNDGHEERTYRGQRTHQLVLRCLKEHGEEEVRRRYQTLCANCHRIKTQRDRESLITVDARQLVFGERECSH